MLLSAIQRLTLLDYPEHVACTVFTPGCNFRCHYCHNPQFVLPEKLKEIHDDLIPEDVFFCFLERRKKKLEGVCITGGEPTIHKDLPEFIAKIKAMGFLVKLDTNGTNPEMLKKLLDENLLDYVAMDIKSMTNDKLQMTNEKTKTGDNFMGAQVNMETLKKSRDLIMRSGTDYEFRTTLVKEFHTDEEFTQILEFVQGAKKYCLQNFRNSAECLDPKWNKYSGLSKEELEQRKKQAEEFVEKCETRQ
jgi:pyruvate formate lyase activating enzyme